MDYWCRFPWLLPEDPFLLCHGLESVIAELGTEKIKRLRVGIGHPGAGKVVDYVLSGFEGDGERIFSASIDLAAEAVKMVLTAGMDRAMNQYNARQELETPEQPLNEWGFILKKYEAVFILDIRKADDEGAAFCKEFGELIESLGGKLES